MLMLLLLLLAHWRGRELKGIENFPPSCLLAIFFNLLSLLFAWKRFTRSFLLLELSSTFEIFVYFALPSQQTTHSTKCLFP